MPSTTLSTSPRLSLSQLTSGNVRLVVNDTNLGIAWATTILAANWTLINTAMTTGGAGSIYQIPLTSGGALPPEPPQ